MPMPFRKAQHATKGRGRLGKMRKYVRRYQRIRTWLRTKRHRVARLYSQQTKPATVYGMTVNGATDKELHYLRTQFLKAHSPHHGSHRMMLAVHGDPAWAEMVAPARMWCGILWVAQTCRDRMPGCLPHVETMTSWWNKAAEVFHDEVNWNNSRGPIERTMLSLRRLGWSFQQPHIWTT